MPDQSASPCKRKANAAPAVTPKRELSGRRRVDLLTFLPIFVVVLPCFGLLLLPVLPSLSPYPLGTTPSFIPFVLCGIFAVLFIWTMRMTLVCFGRNHLVADASADAEISPTLLIMAALVMFIVSLSQVNVGAMFSGDIYKGDLRVNGQLLAVLTKFVLPTMFAYACLAWRYEPSRVRAVSLLVVGATTFVSVFLLGTKAGSLIAILPGVLVLFWRGVSLRALIGMALGGLVVILVASSLFDTSGQGLVGSLGYVLKRTFLLTAEVPYRITMAALTGDSGVNYPHTLMSILTNAVLRQIIDAPTDLYTYSFSGAVSGLLYPELIPKINSGEWNHTPPVYSEGIVALGPFFGLMAVFAGGVGGLLTHAIRLLVVRRKLILTSLMLTYFVFIYIAWLNSAGIAGLAHPFPILALTATGGALLVLTKVGRGPRRQDRAKPSERTVM